MKDYRNSDKDIEETKRRRTGAFYTPKVWVDKAHEYITSVLGENWKEECLVWDNSAGTANLTRDYQFSDLILSTLEKEDIEVIKEQGYNEGALITQMDFLNDEIPKEIHEKLMMSAQEGKRLVFFMNPPYGTSGNFGATGISKKNITSTKVADIMKYNNVGSSQQLYTQFIFQSMMIKDKYKFKEICISLFSPYTFLNFPSFKKFRKFLYTRCQFESGFLFSSKHFSGTDNTWGILFSIWKNDCISKDIYVDALDIKNDNYINLGKKHIYDPKDKDASKWIIIEQNIKDKIYPTFSSGLKVKENDSIYKSNQNTLAFTFITNNVMNSINSACILSSRSTGSVKPILSNNWKRFISLYSAVCVTPHNWINKYDQYLIPDITHPEYDQWLNDCHIYTILNGGNNCTAMRNISYKDQVHNINNHFFWLSSEECEKVYNNEHTKEIYKDLKHHKYEPFMSQILKSINLSPDAQKVYDSLNELFIKSLEDREEYDDVNQDNVDLHLTAWDAGVYQLKRFWKVRYKDDWDDLWRSYKELENRLRDGVYKFGFLK
jgi:hypothetical protein